MPNERRSTRRVYLTSKASHRELLRRLDHVMEHLIAQDRLLLHIERRIKRVMATMENMEAAVTRIEGVEASVVKLLGDLSDEIRKITDNPAAQVLADRVNASADRLAAAAAANPDPTPNEPPADPVP